MIQEIIEHIKTNPAGESVKSIVINGRDYELSCKWKKRVEISISPLQPILIETTFSSIRKTPFLSIIVRSPQYRIRGERTELTKKLLANKFTPALLHYPNSELNCKSSQISFTATLRKKHISQLEKIILYFEALVGTLK
ncbi:hypothetical protein O4H26_06340 [Aequorivita viscosa]|nr:hypothetical protein [Aequorivita viscosa]